MDGRGDSCGADGELDQAAGLVLRSLCFDSLNQVQRPFAEIGGILGDLRFADPFEPRDAAVESRNELCEVGQHLLNLGRVLVDGCQWTLVGYRRVARQGTYCGSRSGCHN